MLKPGAIVLAAAGLLAAPAAAQPASQAPGAAAVRGFAQCVARTRPRVAFQILAEPFGSDIQATVARRRLADGGGCPGGAGLAAGGDIRPLAGALAEASLRARFATTDLARVVRLTPDDIVILALEPRNGFEALGLCVARRAPEAVRTWALSEPGTEAELAARRIALDQVAPCVDQGQPMRTDVAGLRGILSAGLYRALQRSRH